ncbi:MAG: threonine/serine dehydratase [Lachnospiraceae bacterium]|nr:threonine/serine dehydratase [Lachnospiraceae bacterium]
MADNKIFDYNEVKDAYERIRPHVRMTPLEQSFYLGDEKRNYFFKLESFQRAKSFKIRGALNKMMTLTQDEIRRGVATISSGNHGSSVSYAASLLGIQNAKVIVPQTTPQSKIDKIRYFGADVILMGKDYDEAHASGMNYIKEHGMTYIDAYYDDPKIYGGQGTIGIEILEQNPEIDTIVVPIGGGGLITGIAVAAKAIKPGIRIVGVQTEKCPAMIKSYEDGVFYEEYPCEDSICDALVGGVGALSYQMVKDYVDDLIAVSEEMVGKAVSFMAREEKFIVETGSCTTVAAVMDHRERIGGKNIALVLSGGNIDGKLLFELMEKYQ